jgi:N utilization substance protein B
LLKQHLPKDWKWDRINNIEKSILINSVAEIVDHKNPKAIVINEAVEYSKKYADQYSYKLINGVLDNFKQPK